MKLKLFSDVGEYRKIAPEIERAANAWLAEESITICHSTIAVNLIPDERSDYVVRITICVWYREAKAKRARSRGVRRL